jgi:hypothetical protein
LKWTFVRAVWSDESLVETSQPVLKPLAFVSIHKMSIVATQCCGVGNIHVTSIFQEYLKMQTGVVTCTCKSHLHLDEEGWIYCL